MADHHADVLLVGGGIASAHCAQALREEGFEGSILLAGREPDPPYDRPPCSKEYLRGEQTRAEGYFRPLDWYAEHGIELLTRTSVLGLDPAARTARLSTKQTVEFGQALLATGANVRRLSVDGSQLEGIHYLRAFGNADAIRREAEQAERVVLIGGSYIGCEVAASLTALGKRCTIVMLEPVALSRGFGEAAGRFFQARLEEHGVEVLGGEALARFEGTERVSAVVTESGRSIPADLVVIGAGAMPDVMLARAAGLALGEAGGVLADGCLRSSVPHVLVAGDMAEYDSSVHGRHVRIEHWDVAATHGHTAALTMLGRERPHETVPYFWSDMADWASLEYVGPALDGWDEEVVRGSLEDGEFSLWYLKQHRVVAALAVGRGDDLEHARRLIAAGTTVDERTDELADPSSALAAL